MKSGAVGRTANIYEPFCNMFRFLKDRMSLFHPDKPVFVNFAGLRFWVHGCHEWDGILSIFFDSGRKPVERLVLLLAGFFLAPRRIHSRYLVWRDSSRCCPTRWIQPICTSRAFHPMRMSRLDRKIGSFPDMCFFCWRCMTTYDTNWEDERNKFSIFFGR